VWASLVYGRGGGGCTGTMKLHLEMASIDTGHLRTIVEWCVSIWIQLGVFVSQKQRKHSNIKMT
jgi:hypothetical protein